MLSCKQPTKCALKHHVAAMAFPFGSHPIALLNLVKKLAMAAPDTQFSFLSTEDSNNFLFSASKATDLPNNIKPCNVSDGVPMNQVFSGPPIERVDLFVKATPDNFRKGLELAATEMGQISCLITDVFLVFAGAIAEDLNVPWIPLWICLPHSLSAHIYSDKIRQICASGGNGGDTESSSKGKILETIPGLAKINIEDLPVEALNDKKSLFSSMLKQIGNVLPQATALVMSFYKELYPESLLDDLKSRCPSLLNVGFVTVTIPPPPLPLSNTDATGCLSWLDSQKTMSVAYICFGTVVNFPHNEIKELAEALQESRIPFLWSLRENLRGILPDGFTERTSLHGKVVPWAPQAQVLAHKSIGVHVTHCGANSVYESIANGIPMICRPGVFADNLTNAKITEDIWKVGVRVDGGVFTKNGVIKCLELIMVHEQGRKIRRNVQDLQELLLQAAAPNGHAAQDFKTLVEILSSNHALNN
ncbi:hypothetical protein P3X46_013575 [Hevea brasiliensis]|uniref:Glycosyltransferase n=1 Tax=Hevea brasiliensis TaxID=3981 RepID=A0ABQ9M455_HEVBR|nr:anthocyanidin 3-O-glucosyltransferase 7-like [Hevea brasiliensis]KAJ9174986.1 hypothetical protein P3X46_013575 [Hevea brasiliensis]